MLNYLSIVVINFMDLANLISEKKRGTVSAVAYMQMSVMQLSTGCLVVYDISLSLFIVSFLVSH